ncbi:MAG: transglutaminaseTgpA domain-containing protein [Myxococcota bacterium]|nr:transglutaminaseTgpA domain-containing protein [Myxococcota bacterium]
MTPWKWYMVGLTGAVSMSLVAVTLSGALNPVWFMVVPVALFLNYRRALGQSISGFMATVIGLGGFGLGASVVVQLGVDGLVVAGAQTILVLLLARLASAETLDHDQQLLALTLLAVLTATILNLGLSFGFVLIFYAIFASWALLGRQMVRGLTELGTDQSGEVALPARHMMGVAVLALGLILGSSLLFVLFPRIGLNSFGINSGRTMGLPEEVSLDGGRLALEGDNIVAARVLGLSPESGSSGLYLRFEDYPVLTSSGFRTEPLEAYPPDSEVLRRREAGETYRYTVQLAAHGSVQLPALGLVRRARVLEGGTPNPSRVLRILGLSRVGLPIVNRVVTGSIRYTVDGSFGVPTKRPSTSTPGTVPEDLAPFLDLPSGARDSLDLRRLAATDGLVDTSSSALVSYFETMLRQEFKYSLDIPKLPEDSLYTFLIRERQGHCEFFAAGLTLLLRMNGIPARVVGGFAGGTWDASTSTLIFSGRHAHAWVEWWSPDLGWQLADGTPAGSQSVELLSGFQLLRERMQRFWDDYVVDFGWQEQVEIVRDAANESKDLREAFKFSFGQMKWHHVGITVLGIFALGLIGLFAHAWWKRRRWSLRQQLEHYSGVESRPGETLRYYLERVLRELAPSHDLNDGLRELERRYEAFRFGGHPTWKEGDAQEWRRLCLELGRQRS